MDMSRWGKQELESMLEDVVNALDLSEACIEHHGPLGTPPAELVELVLAQKDLKIAALKIRLVELGEIRHGSTKNAKEKAR